MGPAVAIKISALDIVLEKHNIAAAKSAGVMRPHLSINRIIGTSPIQVLQFDALSWLA
jgi:hypothetical protein